MKLTTTGLTFLYIIIFALNGLAQSGIEFDLEKPKKFENRTLGYEKTYQTKFGPVKRFVQNNITHFNYYFNAQQKLNKLIAQAKTAHLDDFTQLLPFYDYSLNTTAADPRELDSVIIKATTGLLIHDLRNDWADNMYMLMGQAYFYKQQFDSADIVFQFVNYAFAPKEKDGYDKIIGSNSSEGGSVLSISTKEKKSLLKSAFSVPPSRNDALLWRIRIAIEQNQPAKASGLIETLKKDPVFPDRLKPELEELHAYHFYKLNIYDSAAIHLTNALENSSGSQDRARKEYLIAQLYERSNQPQNAVDFYSRAVSHTLNPIMDIYARLNMIRLNKDGGDDYIQNNIDALVKMGKRDRYTQYRDIIYYTAAVMEGERKNIPSAANFIDKSIRYNTGNIALKNKAFLLAGDLHFSAKNFELAQAAYDSVNLVDPSILNIEEITSRKNALNKLVSSMSTIRRQDSLQALAALSPEERDKLINQMLKADRKKSDKKDHTAFPTNIDGGDLFAQDNKSGEWYFYNSSVRSKGYTAFRQKWGDRPNVDNWRRLSAINRLSAQIQDESNAPDNTVSTDENAPLTYESLLANIPLTDEQMVVSNDSIQAAMINLGLTYQIDLEDYRTAAQIYEDLLLRFPDVTEKEAVYYNLYYCYWKLGQSDRANNYKNLLAKHFPGTELTLKVTKPNAKSQEDLKRELTTREYESIYLQFIEGNFEEAIARKKVVDSIYRITYWTPQLSYIEALYHIKQRNDEKAVQLLEQIIKNSASDGLAAKAQNMISVLKRRSEIEEYLTNLNIERAKDEEIVISDLPPVWPDTTLKITFPPKENITLNKPGSDSSKIDLKEFKPNISRPALDSLKADTVQTKIIDTKPLKPPVITELKDSIKTDLKVKQFEKNGFDYNPAAKHLVVLLMDKVDPVYVTEARNAFARYNREQMATRNLTLEGQTFDENRRLLVFSEFESASDALSYTEKVRPLAPRQIVPWLPAGKYQFFIISAENLQLLNETKNLEAYLDFLRSAIPDKF